jgi:hypothetical protein
MGLLARTKLKVRVKRTKSPTFVTALVPFPDRQRSVCWKQPTLRQTPPCGHRRLHSPGTANEATPNTFDLLELDVKDLRDFWLRDRKKRGETVIAGTHDQDVAEKIAKLKDEMYRLHALEVTRRDL